MLQKEELNARIERLCSYRPYSEAQVVLKEILEEDISDIARNQEELRHKIKEFSLIQENEQKELEYLKAAQENSDVSLLMNNINNAIRQKEEMDKFIEDAEKEKETLHQTIESTTKQCQEASTNLTDSIENINKKMSLYKGLTNIHWKLKSPEDNIAGFIAIPSKQDVLPFSCNLSASSQYDVTNSLWSSIASTHPPFES